jgi:hypothetical protein
MILSVISQHKTPNFLSIAHLKLETTNQTLRLPPFPNPKPVSEPWQRLFHRHFLAPPCRSVIGGPHKIGKLAYTYDPTGGHGRYIFRWICQKIGLSSLSEDLGKKRVETSWNGAILVGFLLTPTFRQWVWVKVPDKNGWIKWDVQILNKPPILRFRPCPRSIIQVFSL